MNHDDFATYDASYVLGALSPADRRAYELHLADCDICARAVRELAGMPGLLASIPLSAVDTPVTDEPAPELLPQLLRRVRRDRGRRTWWLAGVTGMAAALLLILVLVLVAGTPVSPAQSPQLAAQQLTPTVDTDVQATVQLTNVAWGTKIDLQCTHRSTGRYPRGWYELTVTDRKGRVEHVASWSTVPGLDTIRMAGSTGLPIDDIVSVDVRTASGKVILHLTR